jgi:hypothetical protein
MKHIKETLSMKNYTLLALVALALLWVALPDLAMAQGTPGNGFVTGCEDTLQSNQASGLLSDVQGLITGPFGATVGLVISLFGAYQWLVNQSNWGLVILAGGALMTVFPNVYVNLLNGLCSALPSTVGEGRGGN